MSYAIMVRCPSCQVVNDLDLFDCAVASETEPCNGSTAPRVVAWEADWLFCPECGHGWRWDGVEANNAPERIVPALNQMEMFVNA